MLDTLMQDLRYAGRMMRKSPGFTAVALLTLGLGIGACTAIFSVVHGVLLRPLPYPQPEQLITVWETNPQQGGERFNVSYPNFLEWREQSRSFETMAGISFANLRLSGVEEPERLPAARVSREMFAVLGVRPEIGRVFTAEEDRVGDHAVVLLSHALWKRKFAGDTNILGKAVTLEGMPYSVIGVLPAGFDFPSDETQVFLPLHAQAWAPMMKNRAVHIITVLGRLKPGVSRQQAAAEMEGIAQRLQAAYPGEDAGHGITLAPLHEEMVRSSRTAILVLFGAVVFVLLIACANIANLMMVRSRARQREMAVRTALGGSRWAIARLMLTESLLLAVLAGGAGLLIASWSVDLIVNTMPGYLPRIGEIRLDPAVFGFTALLCLLSAIGFGLAPALQAARTNLNQSLKEGGGREGGNPRHNRGRSALVVAEVSLSLVLLAGAGLMLKSLWMVLQEDPGFRTEQLLTLPVSLPAVEYDQPPSWIQFYRQLPARLEALPGVQAVSAVNRLPVSGGDSLGNLTIDGRPFPPGESPAASYRRVLPNYFRLMGIPLLTGRDFDDRDPSGERVVIINESMARRFWPNGDAIGARIKVGPPENEPWLTIVGVVGDVRNVGLDSDPALATYEPHAQRPWSSMQLVVRAQGDPLSLATALRNELRVAERQLFIGQAVTMEQRIFSSLAPRRISLYMLGLFAILALVLAGVGIYGVMAYSVRERTREIGIRMALGAGAGDVRGMVLRQGLTLAVGGAALGLAAAVAVTRWVSGLLYGVKPTDPLTLAGVTALLLAVAWLACYLPARRATRVDPIVALRHE